MAGAREGAVSLDVVIPVWNEEAVLPRLFESLGAVFSREARETLGLASVRYVVVDDGSRDGSAVWLRDAILERGLPAVVYRLSRNFGHQNAISAGLARASADLVVVIDADLQDPPEVIPAMVLRWREGYDVVFGQRRSRRGNPLKRAGYWAFYRLVAFLADISVPLDSGDFCLMGRRVVEAVCALPERLRFPRGLRAWVGFRQTGVAYDRPERAAGRPKYTFRRLYQLATDGIVSSSVRPLQLAQVFSVSYLVLILVLGAALLYARARMHLEGPSFLVLLGILLILTGNFVQVFCIYILGAYVGRTYLEVKGRPSYLVMEVIGEEKRS
jgi:dolichol-phosphate mannosyltransferase